jgi:hypothetical protein
MTHHLLNIKGDAVISFSLLLTSNVTYYIIISILILLKVHLSLRF